MRMTPTAALTLAFGLCAALTGIHTSPAAFGKTAAKHPKKPAVSKKPGVASAALIAQGKTVSETNGCNSCHAATYEGKNSFSPNIRATGVTAKYTEAKFVTLMHDGTTEDGGHVKKPMPVYDKMTTKDSTALYTFLKSLK